MAYNDNKHAGGIESLVVGWQITNPLVSLWQQIHGIC